jgi:hypothetical protein
VRVELRLEGGKIVPISSLRLVANEGHIHLYLDGSLFCGWAVRLRQSSCVSVPSVSGAVTSVIANNPNASTWATVHHKQIAPMMNSSA